MSHKLFPKPCVPAAVFVLFLITSASARAGQGFLVTFNTSLNGTLMVNGLDYKNWYLNGIQQNMTIAPNQPYYTEECEAFFGCDSGASGDSGLSSNGIILTTYYNGSPAVQFCLSSGAISATCGVSPNPVNTYDGWLAGCYALNSGFTCSTAIVPGSDQDIVTFTINSAPN